MLKMPSIQNLKCDECGESDEYVFNEFGSLYPCTYCDAAPIKLKAVN